MSWLSRVRSGIPFLPKRQTRRESVAQVRQVRDDGVRQGMGGELQRLPALRFPRPHRPGQALRAIVRRRRNTSFCPRPRSREDPLRFKDTKRYTDRLKAARAANGERDALVNARGKIDGHKVIVGVQDFAFMGGSMGIAVGAAFVAGVRAAIEDKVPYIIFTASGGARMQEAILSLMQLPRTTVALAELKEAGLPYIVVLTDPTTGGVTASYAMLGDVQIAEPGALIGFAGQRVIEQTIREKLPEGFQRAEYLLEHGMIDMVVPRGELKEKLALLISYLAPEAKAAA